MQGYILPVHIISTSGANLEPKVFKYSELQTLGVALAEQYCVGQTRNLGWFKC